MTFSLIPSRRRPSFLLVPSHRSHRLRRIRGWSVAALVGGGWTTVVAASLVHQGTLLAGGGMSSAGPYQCLATLGDVGVRQTQSGSYVIAGGAVGSLVPFASVGPVNAQAPLISTIPDQLIDEDQRTGILPFTFIDPDSREERLSLSWVSSNPSLIPVPQNLEFGGLGTNRTVRARPAVNQFGTTLLTLRISDGVHSNAMSFEVVVRPVNDAPTLSRIAGAVVNEDTPTSELPFTIGDLETAAANLEVFAVAADASLVPAENIRIGGTGANRWLLLEPAAHRWGSTTITYGVRDGEATTERSFPFTVLPRNDAPRVSAIDELTITAGGSAETTFVITDPDDPLATLNVQVHTDNPSLLPLTGIIQVDEGQGTNRLKLLPVSGRTGVALITVTAIDPHAAAGQSRFTVRVVDGEPPGPVEALLAATIDLFGRVLVTWTGKGQLQGAPAPTGPWIDLPEAVSPYAPPHAAAEGFYRLKYAVRP